MCRHSLSYKFRQATLLIVATLFFGCSQQPQPLKISTNTWIGYEPIYIAEELKLVDFPIDLNRKKNATDVMALFEKGQIDVAGLTLDEAMLLIEKEIPLYFAAVLDISDGADQLIAKKSITSLSELKGKRIGVEASALGMLVVNGVLEKAKLSLTDVTLVESTVDKHHQLFMDDAIDAAVSFPPFSQQLKSINTHTLYDSSMMMSAPIVDVLVISENAYKNKLPALKALLAAIFDASKKLKEGDTKVVSIAGKNLGLPKSEWPHLTDGVKLTTPSLNNTYINRYKLEATMMVLDEVMVRNRMLKSSIKDKIQSKMFVRL